MTFIRKKQFFLVGVFFVQKEVKEEQDMLKEGQIRIPSGCAISSIFSKDGKKINGESIIRSIATMHDRSNGLGGGFAGYGIYPQYKDLYAFHIFYENNSAREECERFLDRHFDVINLSKIPVKKTPKIQGF